QEANHWLEPAVGRNEQEAGIAPVAAKPAADGHRARRTPGSRARLLALPPDPPEGLTSLRDRSRGALVRPDVPLGVEDQGEWPVIDEVDGHRRPEPAGRDLRAALAEPADEPIHDRLGTIGQRRVAEARTSSAPEIRVEGE